MTEQITARDILEKHFQGLNTAANNKAPLETQLILILQTALIAMEEYASQFKSVAVVEPDIKEELPPVIKFLLGEGELNGKWFGAGAPEGKAPFWWRTELRKLFKI